MTLNVAVTLTGNGNSVTVRDVGKDLTKVQPDGTVILKSSGQVPLAPDQFPLPFNGTLKINLSTGEVIHEPQHILPEVCVRLA